jgi:hypothetical protein
MLRLDPFTHLLKIAYAVSKTGASMIRIGTKNGGYTKFS